MPRAKTKTAVKGVKVNKSAWIRALPTSLSAKDVVDKAKSEGITLSLAQVYTARSTAKKAGEAATSEKRGPGRPKGTPGRSAVNGDARGQFLQLVRRIGTDEANRLIDAVNAGTLT